MTIFTSLRDALHAGCEILGRIEGGYLIRFKRADRTSAYGMITLKPKPEAALADFALSFDRGVPVVSVKGDINASNVAAFEAVLEGAGASGSPEIVVALTMSEYLCRRAYRVLSRLEAQLESAGGCLCISCDPNCGPRRAMLRFAMPFAIFDRVGDAITALAPNQ